MESSCSLLVSILRTRGASERGAGEREDFPKLKAGSYLFALSGFVSTFLVAFLTEDVRFNSDGERLVTFLRDFGGTPLNLWIEVSVARLLLEDLAFLNVMLHSVERFSVSQAISYSPISVLTTDTSDFVSSHQSFSRPST